MSQPRKHISPEEYLATERAAEFKSEYYVGEMFAMSGGSRAHSLIAGNVTRRRREEDAILSGAARAAR